MPRLTRRSCLRKASIICISLDSRPAESILRVRPARSFREVRSSLLIPARRLRSIEIFLNFMVMDMNMNVLLRDPTKATAAQIERMERFWGDQTWRNVTYEENPQRHLFAESEKIKVDHANDRIAEAYRTRLIEVAGFRYAPRPLPFVNQLGATVYYLFFASPNKTGNKVVEHIFEKYRTLQGR